MDLVSELKGDLCIVTNALRKIKEDNDNNNHCNNSSNLESSENSFSISLDPNSTELRVMLPKEEHKNSSEENQSTPTESESVMIQEMISAVKDIQFHNQTET